MRHLANWAGDRVLKTLLETYRSSRLFGTKINLIKIVPISKLKLDSKDNSLKPPQVKFDFRAKGKSTVKGGIRPMGFFWN